MKQRFLAFLLVCLFVIPCALGETVTAVEIPEPGSESDSLSADFESIDLPSVVGSADTEVVPDSGNKTITITFTGDVTLGSEEAYRNRATSFESHVKKYGDSYFLKNFLDLFENDDLTVINLEGVISDSASRKKKKKEFRFRGAPELLNILKVSSVEACNLSNNHMQDYGDRGYKSTMEELEKADIAYFGYSNSYIFEKDGIRIAFYGLVSPKFNSLFPKCKEEIAQLKADGVNAVVFVFHAGTEYGKGRNYLQERFGKAAIDAGADLVIMHHPHVLQGMEIYNQRTICYSLGNFCFGGNSRVKKPDSLLTAVVQADLTFSALGEYIGQQLRIYPAHISGTYPQSNFQPVRVTGEEADEVIARIQIDTKYTLNPYSEKDGCAVQEYLSAE